MIRFTILAFLFLASVVSAQDSQVLASVGDKVITLKEIDETTFAQIFPLQQRIYAIRKAALENQITRIVLENEARRRGISVEELNRILTDVKVDVPVKEVEDAYAENASAFAQMSPDEARERIRLDMETQGRMRAYRGTVEKLRRAARIIISLREPLLPLTGPSNAGESIGNRNAPVTIIEFGDFQCGFCKQSHPIVKRVIQEYADNVRLVFKHLPLTDQSEAAARSAFCAGQQGKFWEYHDALFSASDLSSKTLDSLAAGLNLDMEKLLSCQNSDETRSSVRQDALEARKFGIEGTPAFIVNGRLFTGLLTFEEFKAAIDEELRRSPLR